MCGLAGMARLGADRSDGPDPTGVVDRMMSAVAHRGPDGQAMSEVDGNVRMGFTRLSLVDLVTGGQPFVSEDEALVLIANGEVYNHRELAATLPSSTRLRTRSDCEVLMHLYRERGLSFLDDVRGMFALVLWDRRADKLVMARDRFGIKPLFYHQDHERVVFASESTALFEDPRTPRRVAWESSLGDQILSAAAHFSEAGLTSWFEDIVLVPTASVVTVDLRSGAHSTHRYWELPRFRADHSLTAQDFVDEYRSRLESAVHDCETADVEVGLFLSGGVDSAAIAALTRGRPRTFSALNGSTFANGDVEYSTRIAATLGLDNHQVLFARGSEPTPQDWLRFVWLLATPLAGPEAFYKHELYRYVAATTPTIKAMMLGGGADEFNGGYSTQFADTGWPEADEAFRSMQLRTAVDRRPDIGAWWRPEGCPVRASKLLELGAVATDAYEGFVRWKYRDVQQYNCWHEDRTAAGSGIEARVPFLDHRLIELSAVIPAHLRPELVWDKQMLRRGVVDVLGTEFAQRPKVPFFYGPGVDHTYRAFARMILADGAELLDRALSGPGAREFLDPDGLRAMALAAADAPVPGQLELLLRVANLGLLENLAQELPSHHRAAGRSGVAERVVVADWQTDAAALQRRIGTGAPLDPAAVASFSDSVLLLHGPTRPNEWYVVVDGQIEYVVDELEDATWLSFLSGVDGRRTLADLAGGVEQLAGLETLVAQARDVGLLRLDEPDPVRDGAREEVASGVAAG